MKLFAKILIQLLSFIAGVVFAWLTVGPFRKIIRCFYQWSTGSAFTFYGKDLTLNLDPFYHLAFGLTTLVLWTSIRDHNSKRKIIWTGISLAMFLLTIITYSIIDANLRVISCTSGDNGQVSLYWGDLNYGLIIKLSLLFTVIPLIFMALKNLQKEKTNS